MSEGLKDFASARCSDCDHVSSWERGLLAACRYKCRICGNERYFPTASVNLKDVAEMSRKKERVPVGRSTAQSVSHPEHYTAHPSGVECITVAEHFGFNLGNAVKYIWRADEKGSQVEDLQKAAWYIEREIKRLVEKK